MTDLKFLSEDEARLLHSLDEKHFASQTTEQESKTFEELSSRERKIEKTYLDLCKKREKTEAEKGIETECYDNLLQSYHIEIEKNSTPFLKTDLERLQKAGEIGPLQFIAIAAITKELDKRAKNQTVFK